MDVAALIISIIAIIFAGLSALYTRSQAKTAREAHAHATEAHFVLQHEVNSFGWEALNTGQGNAYSVRVVWDFDKTGREYGLFNLGEVKGGQRVVLDPRKPLPRYDQLVSNDSSGRMEGATIFWRTSGGQERSTRPRMTVV